MICVTTRLRLKHFALPPKTPWLVPLEALFRQTRRAVRPRAHRILAAWQSVGDL